MERRRRLSTSALDHCGSLGAQCSHCGTMPTAVPTKPAADRALDFLDMSAEPHSTEQVVSATTADVAATFVANHPNPCHLHRLPARQPSRCRKDDASEAAISPSNARRAGVPV